VPAAKADIPCPVQRAFARAGHIGEQVPVGEFADLVVKAMGATGFAAGRLRRALYTVGAVANGLRSTVRNLRQGFRPHELRGGPFDKKGGGSRLYSQSGEFDPAELVRFETFAKPYPTADGAATELGWGLPELRAYLDANQKRGGGGWYQRRVLMEAELPVLLRLMGRGRGRSRHLVPAEVLALYRDEQLPERVLERVRGRSAGDA